MNNTKIYKILIVLTVILMFGILISNKAFAGTVDTNINSIIPNNDMQEWGNRILGPIKVVGIFVSVAMTMVVGIKYMLSSVEEKAEYKKTAIAYLVGAILIFVTPQLIDFIYNIINNL